MKLKNMKTFEEKTSEFNISDVISSKNMWLEKLKKDLLQNKYNLNKVGLYNGLIKESIENLLESLKDYDM
jgi:superfamily I DNA and/or RNA helicase